MGSLNAETNIINNLQLLDSIAAFLRNTQGKKKLGLKQAIKDSELDLVWPRNNFYHGRFTFKMPNDKCITKSFFQTSS